MKNLYYISFLAAAIFLSACNSHYYAPVLYKNDVAYQFKPMSTDSSKSATYISGGVNLSSGSNQSDEVITGLLAIDRGHTFENLNLAYGAYGFYGNYQNNVNQPSDPGYFANKEIYGFGFKASANLFVATERADFRIIGIAASYSQESGDYATFRKDAQKLQNYYTDASTALFTAGFTNETALRMRRDAQIQFGYRVFLGSVFGNHNYVSTYNYAPGTYNSNVNTNSRLSVAAAYFMQVHKYNFVAEVHNFDAITIQFGYRF